ncbi:SMP-30/gluconolactonase/LRE family protein [Pseudoduganella sp. OTU4001]|uniref:SMP-30/gluconolactonase/LRE family protein n=1 Tax=Pseudoduganella sp. OTU4001 TaxID=3043854 RepID=UPI00313C2ED7
MAYQWRTDIGDMARALTAHCDTLGEGVHWCADSQRLWWTDIEGEALYSCTSNGGQLRRWDMPERVASLAPTSRPGVILLGMAGRLALLHMADGAIDTVHQLELPAGVRINDGRCDRQGRFVFGTMNEAPGHAPLGRFYRLNGDLALEVLDLPPVGIANSICFSPEGDTMYFCDSRDARILCCDYPSLARIRVFATLAIGVPDGSCVDAGGHLWNAQWGGWQVARYTPRGELERTLPLPVAQPSCVALGGAGLDELFVTSARQSLSASQLALQPRAGALFRVSVMEARGLAESRFQFHAH